MSANAQPGPQTPPLETMGVVCVNYNGGQYVLDAVASMRAEGIDKIVVVDNGSSDGSPERLLAADPQVDLIRLPNPGFGAGNNAGAARLDTDILCLINPDTVVHHGAFEAARAALNSDPNIAMVGAQLRNPDGSIYPSARDFPRLSAAVGHALFSMVWADNPWSRKYKRLDADYTVRHNPDWVSGAAMFVRRSAFEAVGGFDESYFMYFEETDICWRLRKAGWDIVYEPSAVVTHVVGVSTAGKKYRMLKEHHKSAIRYNFRTAQGFEKALLPFFAVGLLARLPLAWLHHWNTTRKQNA